jgi:hypothetical protein
LKTRFIHSPKLPKTSVIRANCVRKTSRSDWALKCQRENFAYFHSRKKTIFLVIEQGCSYFEEELSNKNSTFPRVDGPTQRRSVCVDRKTTFFPVKRGKAKKMGLRASKRGLSGLCSLDPFASCKAIRTNESEIPAPRVDRLGGYFDCVQDLKTRFTRFLGFFWPVTG